jgi:hypothetical protein
VIKELAGLLGKLAFNDLHEAKLMADQRAPWHTAIGRITRKKITGSCSFYAGK